MITKFTLKQFAQANGLSMENDMEIKVVTERYLEQCKSLN